MTGLKIGKIGCAFTVHNTLSAGFLEKVYENAPRTDLESAGLSVKQQSPLTVWYKNRPVGEYFADLVVNDILVLEIKAVIKS